MCPREAKHRIGDMSGLDERVSEIAPQAGIVGLELHRLVENPHRVLAPLEVEQRDAQCRQIGRLRIVPERAGRPFHRMVELLRVETHERHQMQDLGILGIRLEQLSAKNLRIEVFARAHFAEHGVQDRSEVIRRGRSRIEFAWFSSHPVLAVHQRSFEVIPALPVFDSRRGGKTTWMC